MVEDYTHTTAIRKGDSGREKQRLVVIESSKQQGERQ